MPGKKRPSVCTSPAGVSNETWTLRNGDSMHYDYLIVGAGLFGAVFAREMKQAGRTSLVIDRRDHIAGNIYTEKVNGIQVHRYGAHIFHTSDKEVWDYVRQFAEFNHYINCPVARYGKELYNLPFNMNTFSRMWNIQTPAEAKAIIDRQVAEAKVDEPKNLEEQALSLAGRSGAGTAQSFPLLL